jgi:hypothetical protein
MFYRLNSQLCATLGAAALDDSAACFGRNASAKPMRTGAVACVWLVSSFWHT